MSDMQDLGDDNKSLVLQRPTTEPMLDRVAEMLDDEEFDYILRKRQGLAQDNLRKRIRSELPTNQELFGDLSTKGYYEGDVTINEHLSATFRTISAWQFEDAVKRASAAHPNNTLLFERTRQRIQMSYAIMKLNGKVFGPMMPAQGDYEYEDTVRKELVSRANIVATHLSQMSDSILLVIQNAHSTWEFEVAQAIDKVAGSVDDLVGNSTGTPGS